MLEPTKVTLAHAHVSKYSYDVSTADFILQT